MKVSASFFAGVAAAALLTWAIPAVGGGFYRWTDEAGVTHFTDDPTRVPPRYRRQARNPAPMGGNLQVLGAPNRKKDVGAELWAAKCASCHHTGRGEVDEKVGLADVVINPETHFPEGEDAIVKKMRYAADGRFSDMPRLRVSDEELRKIAKYLLGVVK